MAKISSAAIDLIISCEVSGQTTYTQRYQHPTWPGGQSGVTIGIGYDIGQQKAAAVSDAWSGILDTATVTRLQTACGVTGQAAKALTAQLKDVTVTWDQAYANFTGHTLPKYIASTVNALANTDLLPPDCLGALVSLVYNRGAGGFTATDDRHKEMRAIKGLMANKAFGLIPAEFRAMERLWANDPAAAGLVTRREKEAALFETGLAAM